MTYLLQQMHHDHTHKPSTPPPLYATDSSLAHRRPASGPQALCFPRRKRSPSVKSQLLAQPPASPPAAASSIIPSSTQPQRNHGAAIRQPVRTPPCPCSQAPAQFPRALLYAPSHAPLTTLSDRLMEPQNRQVGHKLFLYTMAMFSIPIVVFFISREWVFASDPRRRDMWRYALKWERRRGKALVRAWGG